MPESKLPELMVLAILVFLILGIGVFTMNAVVEGESTSDGQHVQEAVVLDGPGKYQLGTAEGTNQKVVSSRGFAVKLSGSPDSYVESEQTITISEDNNWTVSTWAKVDNLTQNSTVLSIGGEVVLGYANQTWTAWYYDEGDRDSYNLTLTAPNATNFTNLQLRPNSTHLIFERNNTAQTVANITGDSLADAPVNNSNFNGTIEETRAFSDNISATTQAELVSNPVAPQPNTNRTARIMYDEPYKNNQLLFFAPGDLLTSNVQFVDGFNGQTLQEGEFGMLGADYSWDRNGPTITILSDGYAANAPVVYVEYTKDQLSPVILVDPFSAAVRLGALIPVLLILGFIIKQLESTR